MINYNSKRNSIQKQPLLIIVDVSASTGVTKAPVEAETSTIINKSCFCIEFHFELNLTVVL